MESLYKWLSDKWIVLDGKLSFIKPTWLRITSVVFAAMIALQILSSLFPIVVCLAVVAIGVVFMFKMLHDVETSDDDPDG